MTTLGAVVGYQAEAACLAQVDAHVLCSGANSNRARAAAENLHARGVSAFLSFGLAGGLVSGLKPGMLLVPQEVVLADGRRVSTDAAWRARFIASLGGTGFRARGDALAGSDHVLGSPEAKRALSARTGAGAVDMESHAVAETADARGLPFLILRAVADAVDQTIPSAASHAIDADGNVRHGGVIIRLIRRPWEIGALIRLGRNSEAGLATLRRVTSLVPNLGLI